MRKTKLFSLLSALVCAATMWAATGSWSSGSCSVTLTDDGTLTVSGSGAMDTQYQGTTGPNAAPWVKTNAADIKRIVIEEGVTGIGKYSFIALPNLTSVKIANTVQTIGQSAFERCNYLPKIVIPAGVQWIAEDAFFGCTSLTDVYCYPDAATMYYSALDLWNETANPDFISSVAKTTKCHVRTGELAGYNDKYGTTLNVTFVGDLLYPTSGTAPTVVEMPNAKALFYTGSAQELISGGAALNGTFEYSTDGTSWSTALPTATEESEYTVYYRLTGAAGYGSVDYDANNKITASIVSDKGVFQYCYDAHVNPSSYPTTMVGVNDLAEPLNVNSTVAVVNENPRGPWRVVYLGQFDPADESKYGNGVRDQVNAACVAYGEEVNATNRAKKEVYALQQWNGSAWITITNGLVSMYWDGTQDPARFAIFIKGQTSTEELTYLLCDQAQPIHNSTGFGVYTSFPNAKTGTRGAIFSSNESTRDDATGIETAMEALIGAPTNLTIVRNLYKDGCFNTLCLPFSLTEAELAASPLTGCKLYSLSDASYDGDNLFLTIAEETTIEAGMPYLIKWNYGSNITSMTFTGVTVTASTGSTVTKGDVQFVGTIGRSELPHGNADYLFLGANDNLYYSDDYDDTSMKGFRAYFVVNNASETVPRHAPARLVIAPKMPTAIDNVSANLGGSEKRMENGILYIIKDGVKYNAQGQIIK